MDVLSWFALGIIVFVIVTLVYGVVAIHDIPYRIAKARDHPHQDAIQAGGWVSLFTLHAIWPILWIWAYAYDPRSGYSGRTASDSADQNSDATLKAPHHRIADSDSASAAQQAADSMGKATESK